MLNNKADIIEEYILNMLKQNGGGQVELKRTVLADEVSCAPSQVSYVLSTRFTNSRGFKVESQRGLGGYIRITIVKDNENEKNAFYETIMDCLQKDSSFGMVNELLEILMEANYITEREYKIAQQSLSAVNELVENGIIEPDVQEFLAVRIFKTLFKL